MKILLTSLALSIMIAPTLADTITVDDDDKADYNNIQAAIDAASNTDEIMVMPGTYTGSGNAVVNPNGTSIRIYSSDGPETTIIDGENSRRGIECSSGETSGAIFEGFTILQGTLAGYVGGGLYCKNSYPTFIDCTFSNNTAGIKGEKNGGGAHCLNGAPTFTSCRFTSNIATRGAGVNTFRSAVTFNDCTFQENHASSLGGGIYSYLISSSGVEVHLSSCTFEDNTAPSGAGVYCNEVNHTISDCTFTHNIADSAGGGIYNKGSSPMITNCEFTLNDAGSDTGGAIRSVFPSYPGIGDSYFCNNYHNGGNIGGNIEGSHDDLGGNQDLVECPPADCNGDITGTAETPDGTVDVLDLIAVISQWECEGFDCTADVSGPDDVPDGTVDVLDLIAIIIAWGPCE